MSNKKLFSIILLLILILAPIAYFTLFSNKGTIINSPISTDKNTTAPVKKEELVENPLNGMKIPSSEKDKFNRRPLVVMIGNNSDARPPSNISKADMVYEVVAEGGITRLMPIFLQNDPEKIGPIRSIRAYFLYWIMEVGDAMVMHDGWSQSDTVEASAIDLIPKYDVKSLFKHGLYGYRDNSRFAPNNEYVSSTTARNHADTRNWAASPPFDRWKFKDETDKKYETSPKADSVNIIFWTPGDYESKWIYDPAKNIYLKSTGGVPHLDLETGSQLTAKNVIVQFATETSVNDDKNHLLYDNIGSGKAKVFMDGVVIDATWNKPDMRGRTKFYDIDGQEIVFNRGVIWVSVVPDRNIDQVTVLGQKEETN